MVVPVIFFPGNCAEAHALYKRAFGMTVNSVTYNEDVPSDYHGAPLSDEAKKLVLHSECNIYGTRFNMSDDNAGSSSTVYFNIFLSSEDDVLKVFNVLKDGGVVESEPQPVFWASLHCSVKDRFGVSWQIMTE